MQSYDYFQNNLLILNIFSYYILLPNFYHNILFQNIGYSMYIIGSRSNVTHKNLYFHNLPLYALRVQSNL